ncbi:MAG: glycosyltransferase [Pseudomonadota bacterium]
MLDWLQIATYLSLLIWIYLLTLHGRFWRCDQRLAPSGGERPAWPDVTALIPARDEADVIGRALGSVLAQDYPGRLRVILIDDHSADGTAQAARLAADGDGRLEVLSARDLPPGWSGKLWALQNGYEEAGRVPGYVWLSDADIAHQPDVLRNLVAKAEADGLDLVSVMVVLSCQGFWERLLIPPFVLFFQKLYPFAWVNDPRARTAAAAGGCVLLSEPALAEIGGFRAIKDALIDDCALAAAIKRRPGARGIWLGLTRGSVSIRPYGGLAPIWHMVARSAYTQLRYSPLLLAGCLVAMAVTYLVPPVAAVAGLTSGTPALAAVALLIWALIAFAAWRCVRFYGQSGVFAVLLPLAALFYSLMTLDSALRYWIGRGGQWKGRAQGRAVRLEQQAGGE